MTNVLATKLNALSISNLKEVLNLIDGVLVVFEKYDGKQITKRIERARLIKELNELMNGVDYETAKYYNLRTDRLFS